MFDQPFPSNRKKNDKSRGRGLCFFYAVGAPHLSESRSPYEKAEIGMQLSMGYSIINWYEKNDETGKTE